MLTTFDTTHNRRCGRRLLPAALPERGLLPTTDMGTRPSEAAAPSRAAARNAWSRAHGFSVLELLMVIAVIGVLSAIAIGITPDILRSSRAEGAAAQVNAFLKRNRELAISRRRNIEIRFIAPNQIQAQQRPVPDPPNPLPANTVLETMTFEGRLEYRTFAGQPDNPDLIGNVAAINLGGAAPAMFTSEGTFTDTNGDPINASLFLGVTQQPLTANSISILGTTAAVRAWRWNGSQWVR
jgi:prepilin-type N-terminal cleavage/methylation domain-containing protein